jgi:hypothetical protein
MPSAVVDEGMLTRTAAPRLRRVDIQIQTSTGATAFSDPSGVAVLVLRANNTGVTLRDAEPGKMLIFVVQQGTGAPWTWVPDPAMVFAGSTPGATSTVLGRRDIYTLIYDGTKWCEIARALNVG